MSYMDYLRLQFHVKKRKIPTMLLPPQCQKAQRYSVVFFFITLVTGQNPYNIRLVILEAVCHNIRCHQTGRRLPGIRSKQLGQVYLLL